MTGICRSCVVAVGYRNTRGTRLADKRCPDCGGPLEPGKWWQDGLNVYGWQTRDGTLIVKDGEGRSRNPGVHGARR